MAIYREDDAHWPKKNIVGKQELEIRIGNDHIAFEVCPLYSSLFDIFIILRTTDRKDRFAGGYPGQ